EQELRPPYRARAVRQDDALWAVQAARIEVMALPDAPGGQSIDVSRHQNETVVSVDEQRIFGSIPALEERGEREGVGFAVHAERLDGDLWEIRAAALSPVPCSFDGPAARLLREGLARRRGPAPQAAGSAGAVHRDARARLRAAFRRRARREDRRVQAAARERRASRRDPVRGVRRGP